MTLDVIDLLLSKLQIVELNEKDAHDIVHLLCAMPAGGGGRLSFDADRLCGLLGTEWGMVADGHGQPGEASLAPRGAARPGPGQRSLRSGRPGPASARACRGRRERTEVAAAVECG